MATDERPKVDERIGAPGLVGGPGPTPPGVDDGTPKPPIGTEPVPLGPGEQEEAGEAAERSAGTRRTELEEAKRDPEEPDPS